MVLKYIFTLVGLTKLPEPHEKLVLLKFIQDHYGNLSPNELKIAFELALSDEISCDLKHFQNFSVSYLSNVIKAYLQHRKTVVKVLMRQKQKEENVEKPMTEEEKEQSNKTFDRNVILEAYNKFDRTGVIDFEPVPIWFVYQTLEERHKFFDITKERKKEMFEQHTEKVDKKIKEQAEYQSTSRAEFAVKKQMKEMLQGKHANQRKQMIKDSCRKQLIKELFQEWQSLFINVEQKLGLNNTQDENNRKN